MIRSFLAILLMMAPLAVPALDYETEARLKMARQIARERNDAALVARVEEAADRIRGGLDAASAEALLREAEGAVGIDPGGWSMAGQPLFHPSPDREARTESIGPKLKAALAAESVAGVDAAVAEWLAVLGDQAGLPDGRRPGAKPGPLSLDEAATTRLFIKSLASEGRAVRELTAGRPLPGQMLRFYGYVLDGLATIRPSVERHAADSLDEVDALASGVAGILTTLQQPGGHFPFPDLRGRNLRFGDMIEKQLAAGTIEIRDGWVVTADPDGGTQFDTGVCAVALLRAGEVWENPAWTAAGLRAADWALGQKCVANFNYNAFSVSLLCKAFTASGKPAYLDGALAKFRLAVAPGQAPNGRWIDPHNARTVYHAIILRAIGDLLETLPPDRATDLAEVKAVADPAVTALLDEFDAMGITVECLPELMPLVPHASASERLRGAIDRVAASLVEKCTDGTRVKMGAQPHQLAAVAQWVRR
jgi:hypothetical protein